ncbi:MAG: GNAT family N-acetyltransferase [Candidatus Omnitrophica bacterium]|nr:GNAT family N-acetyltransferase [Candidatus Omnitrophota bacterium]
MKKRTKKDLVIGGRYLEPLDKEDIWLIKDWRNSRMDVLRQNEPLTDEDQRKWLKKIKSDKNQRLFMVLHGKGRGAAKKIGYCGIVHMDQYNKRGELSILFDPSRENDTFGYRDDFISTLGLLCAEGFKELGLHKLHAEIFEFRGDVMSYFKEFGMISEGVLREHQFKRGRYYDSVIYSMLREEWVSSGKKAGLTE